MYYYIFGITDKGNYREQNEDCILIDHEVINSGSYESTVAAPFIAAVCDGVGGEKCRRGRLGALFKASFHS